jgi:hypothetical protein
MDIRRLSYTPHSTLRGEILLVSIKTDILVSAMKFQFSITTKKSL